MNKGNEIDYVWIGQFNLNSFRNRKKWITVRGYKSNAASGYLKLQRICFSKYIYVKNERNVATDS